MSRTILFILFFSSFTVIVGGIQWMVWRAFRRWISAAIVSHRRAAWKKAGIILLIMGNLFLFSRWVFTNLGWHHYPSVKYGILFPGGIFFAAMVLAFLLLMLKKIIKFSLALLQFISAKVKNKFNLRLPVNTSYNAPFDERRRQFLKAGGLALAGASISTPIISALSVSRNYRIVRRELFFPNLPAGLSGLTIAQVSDIHSGAYMGKDNIREIFAIVNSLYPNIIALTGDFVDTADTEIPAVYHTVGMLKADYGVFGCLGNHDHFATAAKVSNALEQKNIIMLNNAHRQLNLNGEPLSLIGVDDAGRGGRNFARIGQALKGIDPESFQILLSHRPEFFPGIKNTGIDLMLSGHTHGGQVGIEFGGIKINPIYLFQRYVKGHFREFGKQLYVNVGVGMVGVPIRLVRPEITLLTLKKEA